MVTVFGNSLTERREIDEGYRWLVGYEPFEDRSRLVMREALLSQIVCIPPFVFVAECEAVPTGPPIILQARTNPDTYVVVDLALGAITPDLTFDALVVGDSSRLPEDSRGLHDAWEIEVPMSKAHHIRCFEDDFADVLIAVLYCGTLRIEIEYEQIHMDLLIRVCCTKEILVNERSRIRFGPFLGVLPTLGR
jgi:hypothetical protein